MLAFYYLKNCSTCIKIKKELNIGDFENLIDIKKNPLNEIELNFLKSLSGSYESLFSKRAQLYKKRNLKDQNLSEDHFKKLILEHYTFLKRPILIIDENIYIGNTPKVIDQAKKALNG